MIRDDPNRPYTSPRRPREGGRGGSDGEEAAQRPQKREAVRLFSSVCSGRVVTAALRRGDDGREGRSSHSHPRKQEARPVARRHTETRGRGEMSEGPHTMRLHCTEAGRFPRVRGRAAGKLLKSV